MSVHSYHLPDARCPACDKQGLMVNETEREVEFFGPVLLSVMMCEACGYTHRDVFALQKHQPQATIVKVRSVVDLSLKVIRSSSATVKIPELGAEIVPGLHSEGYITNIEGVLESIEGVLRMMPGSSKGRSRRKAEEILRKVKLAREGRLSFTLILKDPLGNSAIVSPDGSKVRRRRLSRRELSKLKFGEYVLKEL